MAAPARGLLIHILLFCSHPARTPPKITERGGGWDPHCLANNSPRNRNGIEVTWENTAHQKERWRRGARGDPSFGWRGRHLQPRCAGGPPPPDRHQSVLPCATHTWQEEEGTAHRATHRPWDVGGDHPSTLRRVRKRNRGAVAERQREGGKETDGGAGGLRDAGRHRADRPPGRRPRRRATCGAALAGRAGRGAPGGARGGLGARARGAPPCRHRDQRLRQTRARRPGRPARARALTSGTRRSPPPAGPRSRSRRLS